ncbi:MAG TPA: type IV pilus assembly protein PilM [Solirubrobacteraceae bacterium]|jgi:type IV pilus assembly protein PilM|nr:type IV pilus assembly protein PilM [Solirubrobacteraceae bacterium]
MPSAPSFLKAEVSADSLKKLIPSRSAKGEGSRGRSRSAQTLVGLDIQPGYVTAVQVRVNGSISVQRAVGAPLPPDTVREGEVIDGQALSQTLREMFSSARLDRRVRVGVANQRTVLRALELPPGIAGKEMATAVRFQAEDQIPMPLESAVLDHQSVGTIDTPSGPRQRVMVVAAQKDMVEKLMTAVRGAGLRPEGIDLSAFALIRSLYRDDEQHAGRVLYLNVAGLTNMAIAEGTACRFTRVATGGLESMATDVAERNGIPLARARELLAAVDLSAAPTPGAELSPPSPGLEQEQEQEHADEDDVPREPEIDVRPVLVAGVREIAGEVRNSLDFHRSQGGGGEVGSVVLSGAALQISGFAEALSGELNVPVHAQTVDVDPTAVGSVSPERLAVAAGLAVEEAPR